MLLFHISDVWNAVKHCRTCMFTQLTVIIISKGLDIGPESLKIFVQAVERAKTIVWNG